MPIAELRNLVKTYQMGPAQVHALRGVSLAFEKGEYVAVMGPSGSGKSTLLNILGCLDTPTAGAYLLGGENVARLGDAALSEVRCRSLGFIFQSYNLIQQLSVLENIEVPLFYQGWSARDSRHRAAALGRLVGLGDRLHHRPNELSGGQQQRVAIARAMANDPLVILADEPTGNLDTATGREILAMLDQLSARGKTLIMVTHDPAIAGRAHRVVRMVDGRVVDDLRGSGQ
ncbi:MAG: ABC transporter ATP-binding protein [Planctomycetes bacterium]|nr:ABC transporter ATP-binding protein [Planctomycetota bacterium]